MLNDRRLSAFMKEKGLCNRDLADAIGVSAAMMTYYRKNQRTPSAKTRSEMARVLGCTMDDIWM